MRVTHNGGSFRLHSFIKLNKMFLLHYVIFCVAFIFGALTISLKLNFANFEIGKLFLNDINAGFLDNFLSYLLFCLVLALCVLISAFFAFGSPISFLIFALFGFSNGCFYSNTCRDFGFKGLLINIAAFLLPTIILFFVYLFLSAISLSISNSILSIVFNRNTISGVNKKLKQLMITFLISILIITVLSAIRSLLINVFSAF